MSKELNHEGKKVAEDFMDALERYVVAEIHSQTTEQEPDSMGAYVEKEQLRECLEKVMLG